MHTAPINTASIKKIEHYLHTPHRASAALPSTSPISIVLTAPLVNACFGVGVTSAAMDGAAPELNPGRVHRRINTNSEARHAPHSPAKQNKNIKNNVPIPRRASAALSATSPYKS